MESNFDLTATAKINIKKVLEGDIDNDVLEQARDALLKQLNSQAAAAFGN